MLILYIISAIVCLSVYLYGHWNSGDNLTVADLLSMTFVAAMPIINLVVVFLFIVDVIDNKIDHGKFVLLKGRKK